MEANRSGGLFSCWRSEKEPVVRAGTSNSYDDPPEADQQQDSDVDLFEDDDDDLLLAQAYDESVGLRECHDEGEGEPVEVIGGGNFGQVHLSAESRPVPPLATPLESLPGFDVDAGRTWVYPVNYPLREYQYAIAEKALFNNTLVSLPTGLGKTFIAAVVMYNFYRWYPRSKIVFMAPTKPLVAQQIEACFNVVGIPQEDTSQMTGAMQPNVRTEAWAKKRIFFLTPQVLTNDLSRGSCPAELVKCLVLDEAHRAQGNHSYCQVMQGLRQHRHNFRVLALSATPGSDIKAVQEVLANLLISHIELRHEDSEDIRMYTHQRTIKKIVVPLGDELTCIKNKYQSILRVYVNKLLDMRALYTRDETTLTKFQILSARDAFRQNPPENLPRSQYGVAEGMFALCMTLYHALELLMQHGSRSFYKFLKDTVDGDRGHSVARAELRRNQNFQRIMKELFEKFESSSSSMSPSKQVKSNGLYSQIGPPVVNNKIPYVISHPKMAELRTVVVEHHQKYLDEGRSTRVMIFSQYRDSVLEITEMLQHNQPLVKPMSFLGQSTVARGGRGLPQKEQMRVMKEFRGGGFNTLVSTCVGEEGLDIGEVDLIVCYDAPKSPIRLVQRIGRTGRKREGNIVVLVTKGKEEQMYDQSQYQKKHINIALAEKGRLNRFLYTNNPRMVPRGITPVCHKLQMKIGVWNAKGSKKGRKSNLSKITSFGSSKSSTSSSKSASGKRMLLTREEWAWLREVRVPADEIKKLPQPSLTCLRKKENGDYATETTTTIQLGDYQPWQTALQPTHLMGHSTRSKYLVHLTEFINLQINLENDDDPYGLEMAAFLDKAYVEGISDTSSKSKADERCEKISSSTSNKKAEKKKNVKKKIVKKEEKQNHLITSMFSRMSQEDVKRREKPQNREVKFHKEKFKDLNNEELSNDDIQIIEMNQSDGINGDSNEGLNHFGALLSELLALPSKCKSPVHVRSCPLDDFPDKEIDEPESPSDVIVAIEEWIADVAKSFRGVRLHSPESTDDSSSERSESPLPNLEGNEENILSVVKETANTSPEKMETPAEISPINKLSPIIPSSYRRPVRTNLTLCSSTPKVTGRKLFKSAAVDTTELDQKSPSLKSSEQTVNQTLNNCTPQKSPVLRADRNVEKKCDSPSPDLSLRSKLRRKLSKFTIPDNLRSSDDIEKTSVATEDNSSHNKSEDPDIGSKKNKQKTQAIASDCANSDGKRNLNLGKSSLKRKSIIDATDTLESETTPRSKIPRYLDDDNTTRCPKSDVKRNISVDIDLNVSPPCRDEFVPSVAVSVEKEKDTCINKDNAPATSAKEESSINFDLSLNKDLFADWDEEDFKQEADLSPPQVKPSTSSPNLCETSRNKSRSFCANTAQSLLSVTQIIDLVGENSHLGKVETSLVKGQRDVTLNQKSEQKLSDFRRQVSDPICRKIVAGSTTGTSPEIQYIGSDSRECGIERNVETLMKDNNVIEKVEKVNSSSLLKSVSLNRSDSAKKNLDTRADDDSIIHFDLLGLDENELLSDSFMADIDLNVQMAKSPERPSSLSLCKTPRSCYGEKDAKMTTKRFINDSRDGNRSGQFHNSSSSALADECEGGRQTEICNISNLRSPGNREEASQANHVWKRKKRKTGNVIDSDSEDLITLSSDTDEENTKNMSASSTVSSLSDKSRDNSKNRSASTSISSHGDERVVFNHKSSVRNKSKSGLKVRFSFEGNEDGDDDDDFKTVPDDYYEAVKSFHESEKECKGKSNKKKKKKNNNFIETEVEVTNDDIDVSTDESSGCDDELDSSFVNDDTQASQDVAVDMQAVYLQSVVSPLKRNNDRHRKPHERPSHQRPSTLSDTDDSDYMMDDNDDGFVVDNNFVEYDTEFAGDSMMLAEDPIMMQVLFDEASAKKKSQNTKKGKRRRVVLHESSSDEEITEVESNVDNCKEEESNSARGNSFKNLHCSMDGSINASASETDVKKMNTNPQDGNVKSGFLGNYNSLLDGRDRSQLGTVNSEFNANQKPESSIPQSCKKLARVSPMIKTSSSFSEISDLSIGNTVNRTNSFTRRSSDDDFDNCSKFLQTTSKVVDLTGEEKVTRTGEVEMKGVKRKRECDPGTSLDPGRSLDNDTCDKSETSDTATSPVLLGSQIHYQRKQRTTEPAAANTTVSMGMNQKDDVLVLVDSHELSGAGNIISRLRIDYGAATKVVQLAYAHYLISTRMAVSRLLYSVFSSNQQRGKLVQRVQGMLSLYERPVIIVENDRIKHRESLQHVNKRSKYLDTITCACIQVPQLKVLYSGNQEETTLLIWNLLQQEKIKGYRIPLTTAEMTKMQQVIDFYLSLPQISYATACCLARNFKTINEFINSPVKTIQEKGCMPYHRAMALLKYLQHTFREDMLPPS